MVREARKELYKFNSVRVTEDWLQANHWLLFSRANYLYELLKAAEACDMNLYYITAYYRNKRFFQTTFISPDLEADPAFDLNEHLYNEALTWATENYDETTDEDPDG